LNTLIDFRIYLAINKYIKESEYAIVGLLKVLPEHHEDECCIEQILEIENVFNDRCFAIAQVVQQLDAE
jgi:hypothetical protein